MSRADWYDPEIHPKLQSFAQHYRLRTLRQLLKRGDGGEQRQFDFIEHHPVIRPLSDYSLESLRDFRKERHHERNTS